MNQTNIKLKINNYKLWSMIAILKYLLWLVISILWAILLFLLGLLIKFWQNPSVTTIEKQTTKQKQTYTNKVFASQKQTVVNLQKTYNENYEQLLITEKLKQENKILTKLHVQLVKLFKFNIDKKLENLNNEELPYQEKLKETSENLKKIIENKPEDKHNDNEDDEEEFNKKLKIGLGLTGIGLLIGAGILMSGGSATTLLPMLAVGL
ncbi:MAG: hypothetical protein Q2306_02510 (plasmid) [Phytoplasma sp.]|uniref:hypothetical protein n=1 Tax=Phytoplasma sp. TaxID=2155 RepID=UPI002B403713|nr:hypothetical protein [Phytoplasma sp.]WRH06979.1 MAG: hypothetical protein Q2306_02510 [Phytoplasma sp.]